MHKGIFNNLQYSELQSSERDIVELALAGQITSLFSLGDLSCYMSRNQQIQSTAGFISQEEEMRKYTSDIRLL